jgi:hypothetical protein
MKHFKFLLLAFLLISCFEEKEEKKPKEVIPNYNEVALVCSQTLWNSRIGDSLRNHFSEPIIGLPKVEPKFKWNHFLSLNTDVNVRFARNQVDVKINKTPIYKQYYFEARNQIRFEIAGKNYFQIDSIFKTEIKNIKQTIHQFEINFHNRQTKRSTKIGKKLLKNFGLFLNVPKSYYLVQQTSNFFWLRKDERSGNNNLLIYTAPYNQIKNNKATITNILNYRNQLTKNFIQGKSNGSYMITEQSFYPNFKKLYLNNKLVFETRGLWEFENDFMKGPYINYAFLNKAKNQYVFIDGFVFNPNKTKRENIFELEAIIKSAVQI